MRSDNDLRSRILWIVFFCSITFGSAVLGLLQFSWISQAAEGEKSRYIGDIRSGTARSIINSLRDLRPVLPVLQEEVSGEGRSVDYDKIIDIMTVWNARAQYPGLIEYVWIFEKNESFRFDPKTSEIHKASFIDYENIYSLLDDPPRKYQIRKLFRELMPLGYLLVFPDAYHQFSLIRSVRDQDYSPLDHFILIKLNIPLYLDTILPAELEEELHGIEYRIEKSESVPASYPHSTIITYPVPAPSLEIIYRREKYLESMFAPLPEPPIGEISKLFDPPEAGISSDVSELQYPFHIHGYISFIFEEGSLEAKFTRWIITNSMVSAGLLLMLVTGFIVVYFMYRKTGQLRMMEQEFVAAMSHELRLPVTVIKAVGDNLKSGIVTAPERTVQYGKEIHNEAVRLEKMVEGILIYSGLQSKNRKIYPSPVDCRVVADSVLAEVRQLADAEDFHITASYDLPRERVDADEEGLRIILQNLLLNALTHSVSAEPGKKHRIHLRVSEESKEGLLIIVEDNGRGIPGSEKKRVFSPFYRTQKSVRNQEPGSGLGLHLVRQIAKLNNGRAEVESPYRNEKGELVTGCRFTVLLKGIGVH